MEIRIGITFLEKHFAILQTRNLKEFIIFILGIYLLLDAYVKD